jgi:hypothetical protein
VGIERLAEGFRRAEPNAKFNKIEKIRRGGFFPFIKAPSADGAG